MYNKQITLKDIAKALGLSPSTVSRAMQDHHSISAETKKLVLDFAKKHNYKPNMLAVKLRTNKSNTIGVIVPEIVHYFFSTVLAGIQAEAESENFNILICQSNETYEKEVKSVHALLNARVCGILASQSKTTVDFEHFQEIRKNNIHLVFFDRICTGINTDKVVVDDYNASKNAVAHLIGTGCKRIAFLGASSHLPISNNRRMGYEDALRENGLTVDKDLIAVCDTQDMVQFIVPEMLNLSPCPDAFFCINDEVAAFCLQLVKSSGYRVPEDISICGFTNGYLTEVTDPTLTSIDQHGFEMGKIAARLLINRIKGNEKKEGVINKLIKTNLVLRGSTR